MTTKYLGGAAVAVFALAAISGTAFARDQIRVVGSSTVFPYSQAAAEEFATKTGAPAPVVESLGTGGGFRAFCGGIGPDHPDVTGASRAITAGEKELCKTNGVTDITEAFIGSDGLALAISVNAPDVDLTKAQIYLAFAAEIPDGAGGFKANTNKKWSDIDASLPNADIVVLGPPPTSGTRDAFVEIAMHGGCDQIDELKALKKADRDRWNVVCSRMRQDGPFIEAGENDNLIVQRLTTDAGAMGIFGYSYLYENQDKIKGVKVAGVAPNFETIADASYTISRPLFFYVKNAHRGVIPNLNEFLAEYVSEESIGPGGYNPERGLTPLPDAARAATREAVTSGKKLQM
ncbi:MAG: substrate-binding domain-containing protein [Hyphomicrobiaceae bacterium]